MSEPNKPFLVSTPDLNPVSDPPTDSVMCDYCRQTLSDLLTAIAGTRR